MAAFLAAAAAALRRAWPTVCPNLGTQDTESSISLPQPQLIRKIWNFQFIFESGFRYVTRADLELTSILLPLPLAVITGGYHHTPGILYNFTILFVLFCFSS